MGHLIIIRGPLGSGKSTISKKLAERLNAVYISIDAVLEENYLDKSNPDIGCIPAKNFIKANEIILPEIKKQLKGGKTVILDGNFYYKEAIKHLIKELNFPHHVFTLKVPVDVCIERDRNRNKSYGEDAARAVHMLVSRFDYGVKVDAIKPLNDILDEILIHLQ